MKFVTSLGSLIVDHIQRVKTTGGIETNSMIPLLGGAGIYGMIGALLMALIENADDGIGVGFVAIFGLGFPTNFRQFLLQTIPSLQINSKIHFIEKLEFQHPTAVNTMSS